MRLADSPGNLERSTHQDEPSDRDAVLGGFVLLQLLEPYAELGRKPLLRQSTFKSKLSNVGRNLPVDFIDRARARHRTEWARPRSRRAAGNIVPAVTRAQFDLQGDRRAPFLLTDDLLTVRPPDEDR